MRREDTFYGFVRIDTGMNRALFPHNTKNGHQIWAQNMDTKYGVAEGREPRNLASGSLVNITRLT